METVLFIGGYLFIGVFLAYILFLFFIEDAKDLMDDDPVPVILGITLWPVCAGVAICYGIGYLFYLAYKHVPGMSILAYLNPAHSAVKTREAVENYKESKKMKTLVAGRGEVDSTP